MRRNIGRATVILGITLIGYMNFFVDDYVDATDWIDDTQKNFRELALSEGGAEIEVVFHHTATSKGTTAKELCEITNDRFGLGCSYAISIHSNGKVIQMNDFEEHTPSVGGRNSKVISIAFVGNFEDEPLPKIMLERAKQIKMAFDAFDMDNEDFKIKGYYIHKDFRNTACPGKYAEQQLIKNGLVRG